ncbi:MAG: hypothetical protein ACEY3B_02980 [Wolbachia sp.]
MNKSIAVRTFIFEGKLHSKWSVLGTGITSSFVIPVPRHWDPGILLSW